MMELLLAWILVRLFEFVPGRNGFSRIVAALSLWGIRMTILHIILGFRVAVHSRRHMFDARIQRWSSSGWRWSWRRRDRLRHHYFMTPWYAWNTLLVCSFFTTIKEIRRKRRWSRRNDFRMMVQRRIGMWMIHRHHGRCFVWLIVVIVHRSFDLKACTVSLPVFCLSVCS